MNTLNKRKKKLEVKQNPSIQPEEIKEIFLNEADKYEISFLDPTAEEIELELEMVELLKSIDDEWSSLVK